MPHDNCKIADKLVEIHTWLHDSMRALNCEQLHEAHQLGCRILEMLNDEDPPNGIKLIALFEALAVGADHMEMYHGDSTLVN